MQIRTFSGHGLLYSFDWQKGDFLNNHCDKNGILGLGDDSYETMEP